MQNWAQKMKFDLLKNWKQDNLTPTSNEYRQAAAELSKKFYHPLPCIICGDVGGCVGHHIYKKGRHRHMIAAPENIVPVCFKHHMGDANPCAHPGGIHKKSGDTESAYNFWNLLLQRMPNRMAALEVIKDITGKHDYGQDVRNWQAYWNEGRDYEFICEVTQVEPWL